MPTKGGAEEAVAGFTKRTRWALWAVTSTGIYFIDTTVSPYGAIEFFDFKTGQYANILTLEKTSGQGLGVSPDGRWLLYTQLDRNDSDIMLAENFR